MKMKINGSRRLLEWKGGEHFFIVQEYWCTGSEVYKGQYIVMELDLAERYFKSADNTFCFVNRELDGVVLKFK
jgi:hypothetical protein